jgi:hypothetical protein
MAANARDGVRTARYLVRELAAADAPGQESGGNRRKPPSWLLPAEAPTTLLAGFIAQNARIADNVLSWSRDTATALLAPDRRAGPSPFTPGLLREMAAVPMSTTGNALFNAYFYRAFLHILNRNGRSPFLVLENRVDAARRSLALSEPREATDVAFMARVLVALVRAAPIAEAGEIDPKSALSRTRDPNVGAAAIACVALLFGDQGRPIDDMDEDQFFAVVGALIEQRLVAIEQMIARDDVRQLEGALAAILALY